MLNKGHNIDIEQVIMGRDGASGGEDLCGELLKEGARMGEELLRKRERDMCTFSLNFSLNVV